MKKFTYIVIFSLIVLYFIAPLNNNLYIKNVQAITSNSIANCENDIEILHDTIIKNDENVNVNLKIPFLKGLEDKKFENKINNKIKEQVYTKLADVKIKKEKDSRFAKEKSLDIPNYQFRSDYIITYKKNNIMNIVITTYSFTGGEYGVDYKKSIIIDTNKCKEINLQDFFEENVNFQEIISEKIKEKIDNSSIYYKDKFQEISYDQNFYLTEKGLVIYFDMLSLAPQAMGIPEFNLDYNLLSLDIESINLKNDKKFKIESVTTYKNDKYLSYTVTKPEVNLENKNLEKNLNKIIEKNINSFLKDIRNEAINKWRENNTNHIPYIINISYNMNKNNGQELSLRLNFNHYDGKNYRTTTKFIEIDLINSRISEK